MKRYCIKCRVGRIEYFDIISENEQEFTIRITQIKEGQEKITEDFMSKHLFDMCLKTGYIFQMDNPSISVA